MLYELCSLLLRITLVYFATFCFLCPDIIDSIMFSNNISVPDTSRRQRHCRLTVVFRIVTTYPCVLNVPMKLGESRTILTAQG